MAKTSVVHLTLDELISKMTALKPGSVFKHDIHCAKIEDFPYCCGIKVLTNITHSKITPEWLAVNAAEWKYDWISPKGLIFLSDNKKRPDFEALGFKLHKSFRNPTSGHTVYTYEALGSDTFDKVDREVAASKIAK